ncbi:hypothetical protein GCM10010517_41270 [Streptosporangium fragile]|uniref:Methyltransferase type 11 domain-containing protein n=1 Tax=Streptosporangium fragile TaxID=46186 RepID=A0ABN3W272_9ACTN
MDEVFETDSAIAGYLERVSMHQEISALRASALELLSVAPGERALDAGCGLGDMARRFAGLVGPDGSVIAVDVNPAMTAAAQKIHVTDPEAATVTYRVEDICSVEYPQAFDVVWCERVMQHVPDPDSAVQNMARMLSPGGRACVVDVDWEAFVVDGTDEAMTARVLDAFRAKLPQPAVGRTLRRRLVRAGLVDPVVRTVHPVLTSLAEAAAVIPVLDRRVSNSVPEADRTAWFDSLEEADARGEFMMALPIYMAFARKP